MREKSYREQALRILPHICARCGREFSGPRLKELTVHHKDHNFKNNPPDGSNWELLCLYCHDHEHEKSLVAGHYESVVRPNDIVATAPGNPFEQLDVLLKNQQDEGSSEPDASRTTEK